VLRDTYLVRTPENVTFDFELAGLGARGLAWAIDLAVMGGMILLSTLLVLFMSFVVEDLAMAAHILAIFLVLWWYSALLEWRWGGQTVGKRIVGIRTLQQSGVRITFLQAVVRNLVRIVDLLPAVYLVGAASAIVDRHGRRLGDFAAGTIVVRERATPRPAAVVPPAERYNSFLEDPAVVHAVRTITAPERDAMVGLALRRESLPLPVRRRLFARMADHLSGRLAVERPPFLSEERFVLNLTAAVLARSPSGARPHASQ
jgi:uncharacterized RDD family membrane protein YckC